MASGAKNRRLMATPAGCAVVKVQDTDRALSKPHCIPVTPETVEPPSLEREKDGGKSSWTLPRTAMTWEGINCREKLPAM